MKLTPSQKNALQETAFAELRTEQQMLSLLLAEGLRFYFQDREQILYKKDGKGMPVRLDPDALSEDLMDELATMCQVDDMKTS